MNKNIIIGVMYHSPEQIEGILCNNSIPFIRYSSNRKYKEKEISGKHLLFASTQILGNAYDKFLVKRTPVVWGESTIFSQMKIHENIVTIDADIDYDGVISFKEIDEKYFASLLSLPWKKTRDKNSLVISPNEQYGKTSKLQLCVGNILNTLPDFCRLPFMIAFAKGTNDKFKSFDFFVKENRIVNKENKVFFKELDDILYRIISEIHILSLKKTKALQAKIRDLKTSDYRNLKSIKRFRRLYSSYNLSDYLDNEENVNLIY